MTNNRYVKVSREELAQACLELNIGNTIVFAVNYDEEDFTDYPSYWFGAKCIHEFNTDIILIACYGGGFATAIEKNEYLVADMICELNNNGDIFGEFVIVDTEGED